MALSNYSIGISLVDTSGALEANALLCCLYWNDRPRAERIIAACGGGTILKWAFNNDGLTPSIAIIQQSNHVFVYIAGTTNASQLGLDIVGDLATHYDGTTLCNSFFSFAWFDLLKTDLLDALSGIGTGIILSIFGHSLGGSIGHLMANDLAGDPRFLYVELLTIGEPKALTNRYGGPKPIAHLRVCTPDDPVPKLPPSGFSYVFSTTSMIGAVAIGKIIPWTHYGLEFALADDGTITSVPPSNDGMLGFLRSLPDLSFTGHPSSEYFQLFQTNIQANVHSVQDDAVITQMVGLFDDPEPVNQTSNVEPSAVITVQAANLANFPPPDSIITPQGIDTASFVAMAINVANSGSLASLSYYTGVNMTIAFSGFFKFSAAITAGDLGKLDSVCWNGSTDPKRAIANAKVWAEARAYLFGAESTAGVLVPGRGSPQITAIRISDAMQPRNSFLLRFNNQANTYQGVHQAADTNDASDAMSTSLSIRMTGTAVADPNAVSTSNMILVGNPDYVVKGGQFDGTKSMRTGFTYNSYLGNYLTYLCASGNYGFMGQSVVAGDGKKRATAPTFAANLKWELTVLAHGWASGDRVRISSAKDKRFRGGSQILVIDANTIALERNITNGPTLMTSCLVQRVQLANGTPVHSFYKYSTPQMIATPNQMVQVSKKNLARPLAAVSFSRRGRKG